MEWFYVLGRFIIKKGCKMKYVKYTINTTTSACEDICYELTNLGLTALEIEDNLPVHDEIQGKDYEELLPDTPEDSGICKIIFYLEEEDEELISRVKSVLEDIRSYSDIGESCKLRSYQS